MAIQDAIHPHVKTSKTRDPTTARGLSELGKLMSLQAHPVGGTVLTADDVEQIKSESEDKVIMFEVRSPVLEDVPSSLPPPVNLVPPATPQPVPHSPTGPIPMNIAAHSVSPVINAASNKPTNDSNADIITKESIDTMNTKNLHGMNQNITIDPMATTAGVDAIGATTTTAAAAAAGMPNMGKATRQIAINMEDCIFKPGDNEQMFIDKHNSLVSNTIEVRNEVLNLGTRMDALEKSRVAAGSIVMEEDPWYKRVGQAALIGAGAGLLIQGTIMAVNYGINLYNGNNDGDVV